MDCWRREQAPALRWGMVVSERINAFPTVGAAIGRPQSLPCVKGGVTAKP